MDPREECPAHQATPLGQAKDAPMTGHWPMKTLENGEVELAKTTLTLSGRPESAKRACCRWPGLGKKRINRPSTEE
jgi:hypothetical protein